jgi:cystathionine beta-synthase
VIHDSIIDTIGGTPLVRLSRFHRAGNLVAKVETTNPGGSVKDRVAVAMIDQAERDGKLGPGGTIVEPTSGNTGVGLALVGAVRGYRVICTVPDKVSKEKQDLLRAYGVEVIVTPTELLPEHPESYYGVARRVAAEIEGAFHPDQYSNQSNPRIHFETTGPEIWQQTNGEIGVFVAGVGTGGTISGTGRYLKSQNPAIEVVGADPEGSIYTQGPDGDIHQYFVEGVGEDFYPDTADLDVIDRFIEVNDAESFAAARELARSEGILTGGSGGLAVHAARIAATDSPEQLVVVIVPDSGRGYLSKMYDDDWMTEHGFRV